MNRLQKIREMPSDKYADNLVDEICVAMCPEQNCEPESAEQCVGCVKRWLEENK